ncbi:MAG: DUF3052 domain-containing protein [Gemmatimonadetes bacterium]|nr:DUF3052 domain-containing protein [Gemmatimonadota bacterium]
MAGYSGTPLPKKLGIKEGGRISTVGAPDGFLDSLELPPSVAVDESPADERAYDVLVAFAPDLAALEGLVGRLSGYITWSGGLWIAWPKRASSLASDIVESDVRAAGLAEGLVDNKICAVDSDWSGLRFVHRRENRPR